MRRWSLSTRSLLTAALGILAFGFAALTDFDGARADDLDLLKSFGTTGTGGIPPNIMFVLDSSGSMKGLVCEDLSGSGYCGDGSSDFTSLAGPGSSSICLNEGLEAARGKNPTGTLTNQEYVGAYQSDATTFNATRYPVFYTNGSTPYFPPGSTYQRPWTQRQLGTGTTTQDKIDDAIADDCGGITDDCYRRSRCIYSLRTQGYFWENGSTVCGTGDPMGICSGLKNNGVACAAHSECKSGWCSGGVCTARYDHDAACTSHVQCRSGYCEDLSGTDRCRTPSARYLGDFLNFYPPRGIGLLGVVTSVLNNMGGDVRIGLSDYSDVDTDNDCDIEDSDIVDTSSTNGAISITMRPTCATADDPACLDGDPATVCFNPADTAITNYLDRASYDTCSGTTTELDFDNRGTPLAIAVDNAGYAFSKIYDATVTPKNGAICPPAAGCGDAANFIVLITDGYPYNDANSDDDMPYVNGKIGAAFSSTWYNPSDTSGSYLDDVTAALAQIDLRTDFDGTQSVKTFIVSFGVLNTSDPTRCDGLLENSANAGGGRCLPATSASELQTALLQVVNEIITRARGFTAPSVPSTRYSASTSLSSAIFRPNLTFPLWEGHVFGFTFCDESLGTGCTCTGAPTVCVLDAGGNAVAYDNDGYLTSTPLWDAGLCLAGDPTGGTAVPAVPMDQGNLTVGDTSESGCYLTATQRRIYTVVDTGDGGTDVACSVPNTSTGGCTTGDGKIDFTAANVDSVAAFATALAGASTTASKKVVNFYRGFDVDDLNGNGSTTDERNIESFYVGGSVRNGWWKLGDIFHSIPNVVERPTGKGLGAWASSASYLAFATDNTSRIRAMLVGANDGMLHAFHAGAWDATANSGKGAYSAGTGEELWAFVSPELLPKLKTVCDPMGGGCSVVSHKFFVDGSVMVRDIWTGGTDDKSVAANKSKWRTVAVYGHRDGGSTYVALDVTNIENPIYLWQFPQPGTSEASAQGRSWLDTFPAPASIGPLQVKTAANVVYDRWVVLLSGGFDPTNRKGNVLYMLDAYTGTKLWSATNTSSGADTDDMDYSFPATPVFYSRQGGSYPYIAGIVAADHGGQLWHILTSTVPVATTLPYTFTPSLVFRTADPLLPTDLVGGDNDSLLDAAEYQTHPFFFAPTLTRHRGRVRAIIASGDRDQLIPRGTLPPADGSLGSACSIDADCDTGLVCTSGRCSACDADADCGANSCINTNCLHHFCSNNSCTVPVDATGLPPAINTTVCSEPQRLYAINLDCVPTSGNDACLESNLQQVTFDADDVAGGTFATDTDQGWYYVIGAGEKAATPFEIIGGYGMYTTFLPTNACGVQTNVCSTAAKGESRLYARHYVTGKPLDWDNNGTVASTEVAINMGEGVPTAPAVSVAISGGTATPTLIAGGSDAGLVAKTMGGIAADLVMEILRFPVSRELHDALH